MQIIKSIKSWFSEKPQEQVQTPTIEPEQEEVIDVAPSEDLASPPTPVTPVAPVADVVVEEPEVDDEKDFIEALNNLLTLKEVDPVPEVKTDGICEIGMSPFYTVWKRPTSLPLPATWREENAQVAKRLLFEYGDALTLFFTGTVESQVALLAFADAGRIPRVYTVNFQNDQTIAPQTAILVKYYQQLDFKMRVVDVDGVAFWTNTATDFTNSLGIISSNEALRRWGSTSAAGVPVLAGSFPHLQKFDDKWFMGDHEQYYIVDKMVQEQNMQVVPSFVKFSAGQLSSYITESIQFATKNGLDSTFDIRSFAQSAYPEFEIVERELTDDEKEFEKLARQRELGRISICWHEIKS